MRVFSLSLWERVGVRVFNSAVSSIKQIMGLAKSQLTF
jgi:hypothetical protein